MSREFAIMLTVDTTLAYAAHRLHRHHQEQAAMSSVFLVVACIVAFSIHILGAIPLAKVYDVGTVTNSLVYFGIIPALLFARLAREVFSHSFAQSLYGLDTGLRPKRQFGKARAKKAQGDLEGAMTEFRRAYREDDSDPVPLFEMAEIEASVEHYHEAVDLLREITGKFKDDDDIWTRAAFRIADIKQLHLNDPSAARTLLRAVARRRPTSELGRMAYARLSDMREGEKSPNDPLEEDNYGTR